MGIKEVAKLAGVSVSTVSRIVNGKDPTAASSQTQAKIWEAVRELRYVPNQHAQSLKNHQSEDAAESPRKRDIDCIYARLTGDHLDPFFTGLINAVEVEAFRAGYQMRYYYSALDIQQGNFSQKSTEVDSAVILGRASADVLDVVRRLYKHIVYSGLN